MVLRPHAGSDFRPLGKGASGGELSRIMLALEVALAGVETVPTFVFDEVDAGIGGKVAVEVGRRLARLARTAQVIVVTHLPQVAAFADLQVVVAKGSDGRITAASVTPVDGKQRVAELVRMLSGLEGSASGAEHAAELLALADQDRP
jgi:DNA repair protein RecN (Recombination protein N)